MQFRIMHFSVAADVFYQGERLILSKHQIFHLKKSNIQMHLKKKYIYIYANKRVSGTGLDQSNLNLSTSDSFHNEMCVACLFSIDCLLWQGLPFQNHEAGMAVLKHTDSLYSLELHHTGNRSSSCSSDFPSTVFSVLCRIQGKMQCRLRHTARDAALPFSQSS